jgi:hypothetical protein
MGFFRSLQSSALSNQKKSMLSSLLQNDQETDKTDSVAPPGHGLFRRQSEYACTYPPPILYAT